MYLQTHATCKESIGIARALTIAGATPVGIHAY
jgi:hypothetical protein